MHSQISRRGNSFHQRFAKQTSSAAVTSDWSVVLYPGLCNKCHLIHGSSSGGPGDPHKAHTRSAPTVALIDIKSLKKLLSSEMAFEIILKEVSDILATYCRCRVNQF